MIAQNIKDLNQHIIMYMTWTRNMTDYFLAVTEIAFFIQGGTKTEILILSYL